MRRWSRSALAVAALVPAVVGACSSTTTASGPSAPSTVPTTLAVGARPSAGCAEVATSSVGADAAGAPETLSVGGVELNVLRRAATDIPADERRSCSPSRLRQRLTSFSRSPTTGRGSAAGSTSSRRWSGRPGRGVHRQRGRCTAFVSTLLDTSGPLGASTSPACTPPASRPGPPSRSPGCAHQDRIPPSPRWPSTSARLLEASIIAFTAGPRPCPAKTGRSAPPARVHVREPS